MACMNRPEQPLSSIEFEAGSGDYGENGAIRQSSAATDFKARLSVVQGNRMLNHYLLAGGHNPMLERAKQDGNSRLGTTGGRHGFAAPIDPEGKLDPTYFGLQDTNRTLASVGDLLAGMTEEHDDIALGFVPNYYSTDVKRPGPMMALASQLEAARGPLEGLTRAMMACGLSFPAVNLQAPIPQGTKAIALASASCLQAEIQHRLLDFVHRGGNLMLYGRLPVEDLEGRTAKILVDALGIELHDPQQGNSDFFPSLQGIDWAQPEPEVRVWQLVPFAAARGKSFLNFVQTELSAGASIPYGAGQVTLVTAELPLHMPLWRGIFERMGAKPRVEHDAAHGGLLLHRVRNSRGERFLSLINLDQEEKELRIIQGGHDLFGRKIFLAGRKAKLLPINVTVNGLKILRSTTEIIDQSSTGLAFRQTAVSERIELMGKVQTRGPVKITPAGPNTIVELPPGRGSIWIHPV
jgi:beta-galactosidase